MALFLNEEEVARLLPMDQCISALERAFLNASHGSVEVKSRSRMVMPNGMFHFMAAADSEAGVFGYKAYPSFAGGAKMIVMLFDYQTGQLLSCMEGGRLGQIRTGAASGLATKYMANEDAASRCGDWLRIPGAHPVGGGVRCAAGEPGQGVQPPGRAAGPVRPTHVRQPGRRGDSRGQRPGMRVGADVVLVITSSREPVLLGEWLKPGAHVNAAGGNHWMRREIDQDAVGTGGRNRGGQPGAGQDRVRRFDLAPGPGRVPVGYGAPASGCGGGDRCGPARPPGHHAVRVHGRRP